MIRLNRLTPIPCRPSPSVREWRTRIACANGVRDQHGTNTARFFVTRSSIAQHLPLLSKSLALFQWQHSATPGIIHTAIKLLALMHAFRHRANDHRLSALGTKRGACGFFLAGGGRNPGAPFPFRLQKTIRITLPLLAQAHKQRHFAGLTLQQGAGGVEGDLLLEWVAQRWYSRSTARASRYARSCPCPASCRAAPG